MSILPLFNTSPAKSSESTPSKSSESTPSKPENTTPSKSAESTPAKSNKPKRIPKKNLNQIHSLPLPLQIHPLPAFHPSNPISLLRIASTWISHLIWPPTSHSQEPYVGYFSPETRSVHITHPDHVRALWEMGFFGKGTLSRSEPSWLEREKARVRRERFGAEDATTARREERRAFKLERARVEAERIQRQREVEEGRVDADWGAEVGEEKSMSDSRITGDINHEGKPESQAGHDPATQPVANGSIDSPPHSTPPPKTNQRTQEEDETYTDPPIHNEEHHQLTLNEAFFIAYSLGVLSIYPPTLTSPPLSPTSSPSPLTPQDLLLLFTQYHTFPPQPRIPEPLHGIDLAPDEPFLLHYATYHHYRSLGWVVRPGIKFGVDYLLYARGPAFSHAEFGVLVIPSYTHRFWQTPGGRLRRRHSVVERESSTWSTSWLERGEDGFGGGGKGWEWLHAVNRVQSQVKKTLVLAYVEVPSPWEIECFLGNEEVGDGGENTGVDVEGLFGCYKVREFVIRRWVPNRTRD